MSTDEEKEAADVPPPTSSSHLFQSGKSVDACFTFRAADRLFLDVWLSFNHLWIVSFSFLVVSKQRSELVGPEPKRSRSQSPCVAADFKMPTFKPNNPLGETHTDTLIFYFKAS